MRLAEAYPRCRGPRPKFTYKRMLGGGDLFVIEGTIDYGDGVPVSYVGVGEIRDGKVARMTEYFANPFEAAGLAGRLRRADGAGEGLTEQPVTRDGRCKTLATARRGGKRSSVDAPRVPSRTSQACQEVGGSPHDEHRNVPVVRRRRRGGCPVLHLGLPEQPDRSRPPAARPDAPDVPRVDRDRRVHARRPAVHRPERRSGASIHGRDLAVDRVRRPGRGRSLLECAHRQRRRGRPRVAGSRTGSVSPGRSSRASSSS